jgi:hypothetical protein
MISIRYQQRGNAMKYKAGQLNDGTWAVLTGSKYFTESLTDSKQAAERDALIRSMQWYYEKSVEAWDAGIDAGIIDHSEDRTDYLC